jgi:hypothetical protein
VTFVDPPEQQVQVKWVDPETKEEIDTGLVRVKAANQTAGGGSIDVGGGGEFGGAGEDEGVDDAAETKLDQFWTFPAIEVRLHLVMPPTFPRWSHGCPRFTTERDQV